MRLTTLGRAAVAAAAVLLAPAAGPAQVALNQVDTFEGGTTQGWTQGAGAPVGSLVVATGGPAGPADHFLQVTARGGFGAGSRLTTFNQAQWTGDYNAAGVTMIELDFRAPTSNPQALSMRIGFRDAIGSGYVSNAFTVPADGVWRHAVFHLTNAEFTPVGGPSASLSDFLSSVPEMRILHATAPTLNGGDPIAAVVGIDNIKASFTPVPEPASVLAVAAVVTVAARPLLRRRASARPG